MAVLTKKGKQQPLDRRKSLAGIPVINENVTLKTDGSGHTTVVAKFNRGRGFLSRFQPETFTRRFELDELGTYVIKLLDAQRNVSEIIAAFVEQYRINRREAELCITAFLKTLTGRGIVSILIP